MHNESSASGQAPEEEGPGRRVQRSRSAQARLSQWNSIRLVLMEFHWSSMWTSVQRIAECLQQ